MRVLVLDEKAKEAIRRVIAYADNHRFTTHDLMKIMEGMAPPAGDDSGYACVLEDGFRIVFSYEQQPDPIGWARHISISVAATDRLPHPAAVTMIIKEFGFSGNLDNCQTWVEDLGDVKAINVLEKEV